KMKSKNILETRMKLNKSALENTMGVFQKKRISLYKGIEKVAPFFDILVPIYKNHKIQVKSKHWFYAFINGIKGRSTNYEFLWNYLKFYQFIEESYKFLLRKLGLSK
ncbi:MAG: hypothetical protein U9N34_11055, partial [Candidatus Cloacimonadota bacterium]|nr:hypothetical protein [Candidatus Cloacimonadota bacterium]